LTGNLGNIALLTLAEHLGLVPAPLGIAAADAYRTYRRRQHALRLRGERYARVEAAELAPERAAVGELWSAVFGI
jgi:glutamate-ammonia-ligase adenylyltransferase